jgi:hypothetical protein
MLKKNELISAPATIQTVTPAIFAAADVCGPVEVFISQSLKLRLRLGILALQKKLWVKTGSGNFPSA